MTRRESEGMTHSRDEEYGAERMDHRAGDAVHLEQPDKDQHDRCELHKVGLTTHGDDEFLIAAVADANACFPTSPSATRSESHGEKAEQSCVEKRDRRHFDSFADGAIWP